MFKVVVEKMIANRYGITSQKHYVVLDKAVALKKATAFARNNVVEVTDPQGNIIAQGDPIFGLKIMQKDNL